MTKKQLNKLKITNKYVEETAKRIALKKDKEFINMLEADWGDEIFNDEEGVEISELLPDMKASNPKDNIGVKKVSLHVISSPVLMEASLGMLDGDKKYGAHNYRVAGVRASVYYDAAMRHLMAWWEGEDIDADSGIHHVGKVISCLSVLRDAQMNDMCTDDRPPKFKPGWMKELNEHAKRIIEKYPNPAKPYLEIDSTK